MSKYAALALLVAASAIPVSAAHAACDFNAGDDAIRVQVDNDLQLGRFTTPDTGTASLSVDSQGSRVLPPTLDINNANRMAFGDLFQAARVSITGDPGGCFFRIVVSPTNATVTGIDVQGQGQTLVASGGGYRGALGSDGMATVLIGATVSIDAATNTGSFGGGTLSVDVEYID